MLVNNAVKLRSQPHRSVSTSQRLCHFLVGQVNLMFGALIPRHDLPYAFVPRPGGTLTLRIRAALRPLLRWPLRYARTLVFAAATGTLLWYGGADMIRGAMTPADLAIFLACLG